MLPHRRNGHLFLLPSSPDPSPSPTAYYDALQRYHHQLDRYARTLRGAQVAAVIATVVNVALAIFAVWRLLMAACPPS